jgi:uncharacterized protein YggL (DUF469 family)
VSVGFSSTGDSAENVTRERDDDSRDFFIEEVVDFASIKSGGSRPVSVESC